MRFEKTAVFAGALVLLGAMATEASAQGSPWVELGCRKVSFNVDRDVLSVGRREGRFRSIRLHARGGDIEMLDVKVIYGNGEPEDVAVRHVLRRGGRTAAFDLRGWERNIARVEMFYRAIPNYRGRDAVVCVEGLPGRPAAAAPVPAPGPGAGAWVDFGCRTVSFNVDRDVLRVGRREGRFKAIRLHARGAPVEILDVKVIYANGQPDDVPVRHVLRRGEYTQALDLKGWERRIAQIEMFYRAIPNYRGREAVVCIQGLQ
jgi:hypothetical protein